MEFPLSQMKILDFTTLLPGPYGTMVLADHGADIIKVENFRNPDLLRALPPFVDSLSAGYAQLNRGKKSMGLDLKKEEAREVVYRLVREYDIVIEQFRPGVMERLGIGYERLREINSSLIYCSITGYGQTGSYRGRAGHDINYLALSGISSFSGRKESGPSPGGIQIADLAGGGMSMVIAVLIAYIKRLATGTGEKIDLSMTDAVFSLTSFTSAGILAGERPPAMESSLLNGGHIYDYYLTSDGRYLSVGPIEEKFFREFCSTLGIEDFEYSDIGTEKSIGEMKSEVARRISEKTLDQWTAIFREADACVEPVLDLDEAMSSPPLSEREMVVKIKNSSENEITQVGNPLKYASGTYHAGETGRSLGYDNRSVLEGAGYSGPEIEDLYNRGIINL
jgi:crotonobetainyl-CoA:carnitine CoA-transferase CaiB-like acyl-CoA transferase